MQTGTVIELITSCIVLIFIIPCNCVEILHQERHPIDHNHDYDHNETDHGHARDHAGHHHPHRTHSPPIKGHEIHHLNFLITKPGYDIRDRPRSKEIKPPIEVYLSVHSQFIETIDERKQEIVAAMALKTRWRDGRVRDLEDVKLDLRTTQKYSDAILFPGEIKDTIWVPDLYLPMARDVNIPTIVEPPESVRLGANGSIEYSSFFVVAFKCQMKYSNYPMDEQHCHLDFMSYSRNVKNMILKWDKLPLSGNTVINTRHFQISVFRPLEHTFKTQELKQVLRIKLHLRRFLGFHIVRTYIPSVLLVCVGWLSLLVPLDFAYGRMVLSVTTLLVLVSIFVTTSQHSPGVNEIKALDVWLFMCICFVFTAIINCIVDLRLLSIVEKESQIAAEDEAHHEQLNMHLAMAAPPGVATYPATPGVATYPATPRVLAYPAVAQYGRMLSPAAIDQPGLSTIKGMPRGLVHFGIPGIPSPKPLPPIANIPGMAMAGMFSPRFLSPGGLARPQVLPPISTFPTSVAIADSGPGVPASTAHEQETRTSYLHGRNMAFSKDRQPLVATDAVVWWLRLAIYLERCIMVLYPTLYVLFVAIYWGYYISKRSREEDVGK